MSPLLWGTDMKEREREKGSERERVIDRQRHTDTEREVDKQTETERNRERKKERDDVQKKTYNVYPNPKAMNSEKKLIYQIRSSVFI